ncbi:DNA mismatch repair protein MSH7 [Cornus florida]|uniref:DNA mismatch repair protein MSH7 n=1 Tax=Cornus florida TaxID=4283 RepID=UPI00289FD538|nr:DNA mismatch repair protein MSH7 [Cornus florida]
MQRQKSILSFLQKPSPENQKSGGNTFNGPQLHQFPAKQQNQNAAVANRPIVSSAVDSCAEIRGTDTPPEKVPRQIFPPSLTANDDGVNKPSLFSSIKHKFLKDDDREKCRDRNKTNGGSVNVCSVSSKFISHEGLHNEGVISEHPGKEIFSNFNRTVDQGNKGCPFLIEIDDDILGPETPGVRPLVPRLKRVQEANCNFELKSDCSLLGSSKRVKLLQDSEVGKKNHEELSGTTSKFEWLDPSRIRDANGRRPNDALYDKRTLYIPPDALRKLSTTQKQYWNVKCQYMDTVIFFKVGKFYELYELDAEIGHKELDWKMTMSGVGKCRQVGISESGIDEAIQKLIARGYKVGRMEQLETSEQAKARGSTSVIQRKLVHVLTPSTTIDGNIGPDAVHLLAIKEGDCGLENGSTAYGFAFVDCAALKFWVGSISDDASCAALGALLMQVSPKEVIYECRGLSKEAQKALKKYSLTGSTATQLTPMQPATDFVDASEVRNLIQSKGYFKKSCSAWNNALDGVMHHDLALCALGGLISHLSRLMLDDALHNGDILLYQVYRGCLRMDGQTFVNLEIFSNNADGGPAGTLYKFLDNCMTSSGKRLLRTWICHPLKDVEEINLRLNAVEELMTHSETMLLVAQYLRKLPDLERLLGRVKASIQSSASLLLPLIGKKVLKQRVKVFGSLVKGMRVGIYLLSLLQKEGHVISSLLKILNLPMLSGTDGLNKFLEQLEAAVDSDFPSYQDHDVMDSDAEILAVLTELFIEKAAQWSQIIYAINCIDVLRSFAVTANFSCGAMCRPVILPHTNSMTFCQETSGPILKIKGLWHPFALGENGGLPVPNDICLGEDTDGYHPRTLLLTGPNMGGKSTLLRTTCLAVILAQLGCYVPCEMCVLSVVDIIFTRLGATDRIMTGESTFFIECTETASVLQNATQDSLVLLDELGRGTSTFDGYAIAYAVFRHLVEKVNCRLLFATHYHPLTKEFASHPHVTLQHMACTFKLKSENLPQGDQELVFLYRLTSGACPESYGMQVALMAGIPKQVVEIASRASQVMKRSIGENFRSSEQRSEFSTLHEEWLKGLLNVVKLGECNLDDDDACDTLFCLWHELKSSYQYGK